MGARSTSSSLDDGYSPPKTVEQARKLVEQEQVLLIFNSLGTPTNTAIHKYMNAKKTPQLFVATGAGKWNDPKHFPWTMGWQPSYPGEAEIYAAWLLKNKPNAKVGILYQNDDYGKDYLNGFLKGLGKHAKKMVVDEGVVRGDRSHDRLADHQAQGFRRRHLLQHHHAEVRRAGDPRGLRHRLEAAAVPQQRVDLGRQRPQARRVR